MLYFGYLIFSSIDSVGVEGTDTFILLCQITEAVSSGYDRSGSYSLL